MRRVPIIIAIVMMLGRGMAFAYAQSDPLTEERGSGGQDAGCGAPIASPMSSPEVATVAAIVATAIASPDASPAALGLDPCATPEMATPGT